jgi:hypothetical protein
MCERGGALFRELTRAASRPIKFIASIVFIGLMGKVRPLPMSAQAATRIIREIAKQSDRVEVVAALHEGAWRSVVDHLEVIRCLEAGKILAPPTVDMHGNVVCTMQRYGAGAVIEITVVICHDGEGRRLIVTGFECDGQEA